MEVGLGPVHIVLDGDTASLHKKGAELPIFGPCLLWPNGWMDEGATWYGGRPRHNRHPAPPSLKRGRAPNFRLVFYCGQTAACIKMPLDMEVGLGPVHIVLEGDTAPLLKKGAEPPIFGPSSL